MDVAKFGGGFLMWRWWVGWWLWRGQDTYLLYIIIFLGSTDIYKLSYKEAVQIFIRYFIK